MKPFLKWAGGKYKIIPKILESIPKGNRLVEPFAGSGAVFLNAGFPENLVADNNLDLINLYQTLQKNGLSFIDFSESFFNNSNTEEKFYQFRETFNTTDDTQLKSALFIYLNRHCFNGLCRYNSKGCFNVPFGRYTKPIFPREALLSFLRACNATQFIHQDFRKTLSLCKPGDVVYCDPPYAPLSLTANFSAYTKEGFTQKDQEELAKLAIILQKQKISVVISNHDTAFTRELYQNASLDFFPVQRFIASSVANRVNANELIASYV